MSLQVCGQYEAPEVESAADWLLDHGVQRSDEWFFYGTYYYAQGMYQKGGEHADHARRAVESALIGYQDAEGYWSSSEAEGSKTYATSLALLALGLKYHYLPIYQK